LAATVWLFDSCPPPWSNQLENQSNDAAAIIADLQRLRAFDQPSHDRLMATVAALQDAGLLPQPDQRALFSSFPDLAALMAEAGGSLMYGQVAIGLDATAQARSIRDKLQIELRRV
jgi:hypothetical protein